MAHEIGSEFWWGSSPVIQRGAYFNKYNGFNIVFTLCGRTAEEIIFRHLAKIGIKSLYMPSYCCHSMLEPITYNKIDIKFYDIEFNNSKFTIDYDFNNNCDAVFLINYFGYSIPEISEISLKEHNNGKIVVFDSTHTIFNNNSIYFDYIFGSFRKWGEFNLGFYASREKIPYKSISKNDFMSLRNSAFKEKSEYINNKHHNKTLFLKKFITAEELLELDYYNGQPDPLSIELLNKIDINKISEKRRINAYFLINAFLELESSVINCINILDMTDVPLFVPIFISNNKRDYLRSYLIKNNIYLPIHWPLTNLHKKFNLKSTIYQSELSIVCDHRYNLSNMKFIIDIVKQFLSKQ